MRSEFNRMRRITPLQNELSNTRDKSGVSPLHIAVRVGSSEIVGRLLQAKADPNLAAKDGSTPLLNAVGNLIWKETTISKRVQKNYLAIAKMLLEAGADILSQSGEDDRTTLHDIIASKNDDLLEVARERIDPRALSLTTRRGHSVLHEAVVGGFVRAVELLAHYQNGALLDMRDENGHTALTLALSPFVRHDKRTIVSIAKILLNSGANPFAVDNNGSSVVQAIKKRNLSQVPLFCCLFVSSI